MSSPSRDGKPPSSPGQGGGGGWWLTRGTRGGRAGPGAGAGGGGGGWWLRRLFGGGGSGEDPSDPGITITSGILPGHGIGVPTGLGTGGEGKAVPYRGSSTTLSRSRDPRGTAQFGRQRIGGPGGGGGALGPDGLPEPIGFEEGGEAVEGVWATREPYQAADVARLQRGRDGRGTVAFGKQRPLGAGVGGLAQDGTPLSINGDEDLDGGVDGDGLSREPYRSGAGADGMGLGRDPRRTNKFGRQRPLGGDGGGEGDGFVHESFPSTGGRDRLGLGRDPHSSAAFDRQRASGWGDAGAGDEVVGMDEGLSYAATPVASSVSALLKSADTYSSRRGGLGRGGPGSAARRKRDLLNRKAFKRELASGKADDGEDGSSGARLEGQDAPLGASSSPAPFASGLRGRPAPSSATSVL